MTQKFKVGDKVKIISVSGNPLMGFKNREVVTIMDSYVNTEGEQRYEVHADKRRGYGGDETFELVISKSVENKSKKKARISTLESQVAELIEKFEELESKQKPKFKLSDAGEIFIHGKSYGKVTAVDTPALSANELVISKSVENKSKKKARISALESQVAELIEKVEELESKQKPKTVSDVMHDIAQSIEKARTNPIPKSPNEQRKAIIAEAKDFFVKHTKPNTNTHDWDSLGAIVYGCYGVIPKFFVSTKKRIVTLELIGAGPLDGRVKGKYFAECAPDDVFNADILKAIALGDALGLDVSKFEQAVNPTEVVAGSIAYYTEVGSESNGFPHKVRESEVSIVNNDIKGSEWDVKITDDTDAQY